ncbi:MAG: energy transducer TonB [Limisphaerales bacterium]
MKSLASLRSAESPDARVRRRPVGVQDVSLVAVITAVLWLGCLAIGVLGLHLTYPQPRSQPNPPPPVQAGPVEVLVSQISFSPPDPMPAPPRLVMPTPAPAPMTVAEAPSLSRVAEPSPAVAFAWPVPGPVGVPTPVPDPAVAVSAPATTTTPQPPVRPLVLGQGEGRQPAPEYPAEAMRSRQEGTVRLSFSVGEDGRVLDVKVVVPSAWPLLDEAALRTVSRRWKFAPGSLRTYEVPIRFELK